MFRGSGGSIFSPFQKTNKKGVTGAWQRMRTIVKVELARLVSCPAPHVISHDCFACHPGQNLYWGNP